MNRTPERIAIIGAGPVGLEAALVAAEAGLPFTVYESAEGVGGSIEEWGHVRLFTPWSMNLSERARRRLESRGAVVPAPDDCPTGAELVREGLAPIAREADIAPHIRYGTSVLHVGRERRVKNDEIGTPARAETPFRLLLRNADGVESVEHADVVLDCSGSWSVPNALGSGGVPAPGESSLDHLIHRRIPDLLDEDVAEAFQGGRILLVGAGHSAQTAARDLAALVDRAPDTRVTWLIRSPQPTFDAQPDDPLPARAELAEQAGAIVLDSGGPFEIRTGRTVQALTATPDGIRVSLEEGETVDVDRIVALTGSVGDRSIHAQLQIHECYATQGPMKLAAALLSSGSADCLAQESHGADTLRNPEPGYFILGSKSYGRNTTFLLKVGYDQVDEVFSLIGGRAPAASGAA